LRLPQLLRTASAIASYCVNYCVNHQAAPLWAEGCGESHHHNCEAKGMAAGGPRSLRSFTSPGENGNMHTKSVNWKRHRKRKYPLSLDPLIGHPILVLPFPVCRVVQSHPTEPHYPARIATHKAKHEDAFNIKQTCGLQCN
jgi:hypothetical protein